ncbi:MAG: RIP metalloprotease RseP [Pseudomonadota bacterium]
MIVLQYVLPFLVVLGTLIIFHELGHYWVARWCGVKVLRFSVGMGKVIFSRRIGPDQTEWVISILPLGGYVKMLDAREQKMEQLSPEDVGREFTGKNVWRRIAIVAAGPIANFLLAIAIFAGLYHYGMPEPVAKIRTVAESTVAFKAGLRGGEIIAAVNGDSVETWTELHWKVMRAVIDKLPVRIDVRRENQSLESMFVPTEQLSTKDLEQDFLGKLGLSLARPIVKLGAILPGPALAAGLQAGDQIVAVDGNPVIDDVAFIETISNAPGKSLELTVLRGDSSQSTLRLSVVPSAMEVNGKTVGKIHVKVAPLPEMIVVKNSFLTSLRKAVFRTWESCVFTLKILGKMIIGEASLKNISGPITIAEYAGQSARIGGIAFLTLIASVSIGLGVMNLLPIPVLDGGLLLYYSLEVLTGRPVSERFAEIAQRAGVGILMTLMAVAIFNDILRLIS